MWMVLENANKITGKKRAAAIKPESEIGGMSGGGGDTGKMNREHFRVTVKIDFFLLFI